MPKITQCPCDPTKSYALCCGRYHKGKIHAPTAETLMRSRYSAYVLNIPQYIYRTWDEDTRPTLAELRESNSQQFIKLDIISTTQGGQTDDTGTVEFSASYNLANDDKQHAYHENSTFIKRKKRWYYVEALR